jgi:NDP-sugar pyrophosphorylase family protein
MIRRFVRKGLMKGVILAGGEGTRLRPLTLALPKPVVPVVDRPLLEHQLDLLGSAGVTEVVFSVAYRPEKVQAIFGDGRRFGKRIVYAVEESPLGTGGAVKNAEGHLDDLTVVLNGDILTDVEMREVVAQHKASGASATLVLAPVPNPAAFGLVETDPSGRVVRFTEKPDPSQITTDTINAGIYLLQTSTLSLIPPGQVHSIERGFFPALLARGDLVRAHVHRGYWIDVGTPAQYLQVHRDALRRRFPISIGARPERGGWIDAKAYVEAGAELCPPFFVGPGCRILAGAALGPDSVLVSDVHLQPGSRVVDSVIWSGGRIGARAEVRGALLGTSVRVGSDAAVGPGAVLGEGTVVSEHSRLKGPCTA